MLIHKFLLSVYRAPSQIQNWLGWLRDLADVVTCAQLADVTAELDENFVEFNNRNTMTKCCINLIGYNARSLLQELKTTPVSNVNKPNSFERSSRTPAISLSLHNKCNSTDDDYGPEIRPTYEIMFIRDVYWLKSFELSLSNTSSLIEQERDDASYSRHKFPLCARSNRVDSIPFPCKLFNNEDYNDPCINEATSSESLLTGSTPEIHRDVINNNFQRVISETPETFQNGVADSAYNTLFSENTTSDIAKNHIHVRKQCTNTNDEIMSARVIQNAQRGIATTTEIGATIGGPVNGKEREKNNSVKRRKAQTVVQGKPVKLTSSSDNLKDIFTRYNTIDIVRQSIRNVLSILCEEKENSSIFNLKKYEAVRAILRCVKVGRKLSQFHTFTEHIVEALQSSFERIIYGNELHNVRSWMYRLLCVLELCNSPEICVGIIEFLITGLDIVGRPDGEDHPFFAVNTNSQTIYNQLHVLVFGLDITVRKMQEIMPHSSSQQARRERNRIPSVELSHWECTENDVEMLHTGYNSEDCVQRWTTVLQKFGSATMECSPELAVRSLKLRDTLFSQKRKH